MNNFPFDYTQFTSSWQWFTFRIAPQILIIFIDLELVVDWYKLRCFSMENTYFFVIKVDFMSIGRLSELVGEKTKPSRIGFEYCNMTKQDIDQGLGDLP